MSNFNKFSKNISASTPIEPTKEYTPLPTTPTTPPKQGEPLPPQNKPQEEKDVT